jgi:tetratricopeptide (TPR) repeat protein
VFGRPEGLSRLAASIHRVAAGSPMLCTELVRHLVDERVVRYQGGMWLVPDEIDESTLPSKLEHAMDARIAGLSATALGIARALSVHRGELTMAECVKLSNTTQADRDGGGDEDQAFAALDELVRKGVVVGTDQRYRMFHDGLTEAAIRSVDDETRRALELRVADLLLEEGQPSAAREARIGWHLLRGGREEQGAKLLARSGKRLFEATSFEDAVPQLEAALGVYTAHGAKPRLISDLYVMLITAGFYSDRAAVRRHADDAVAVLERFAGLHWARPVGNVLGRWIGLLLGLAIAYIVYALRGRSRECPVPTDAAKDYARTVTYVAGVAGFSFDTDELRRAVDRAVPLEDTPRPELRAVTGFIANLLNFNLGRIGTLLETSDQALAMFEESTDATEVERDMGVGGARFQRGLIAVRSGNPEALQEVDALRRLGRRLWDVGAVQLRAYYHLWRGEESIAKRYRAEIELEHLRLGSLWQLSAVDDSSMALITANMGDVLGLRRTIVAMERLAAQGMQYQGHLAVSRAEYHRLRREYDRAAEEIETAFELLPDGEGLVRPWALCARADIELESGTPSRAEALAAEALKFCADPEYGQVPYRFRAARTLALARAKNGQVNEAIDDLEALLAEAEKNKNPLIIGLLHEALARVAFADGQERRAEEHALAMETRLAATRNPVLIARCERLRRLVRPDDFEPADEDELDEMVTEVQAAQTIDAETLADMMSVLSGCHTADARAQRALELVMTTAGVRRGFLWVCRAGKPQLAAPARGDEPPGSVSTNIETLVEEAHRATRASSRFVATEDHTAWVSRVLTCKERDQELVVGAVALLQPEGQLPQPPGNLLEGIARRLYEAGDVALTPIHPF